MFKKGRRGRVIILLLLAVLLAALAGGTAFAGRHERIARYWALAQIDATGQAKISEQIDYDFGNNSRHDIFRVVPGLAPSSDVVHVTSPDAPAGAQISSVPTGTEIRIGDPLTTITGQHRYLIDYSLETLERANTYAWNVHGTDWNVGAQDVTGTLLTPYALGDLRCAQGTLGSKKTCNVSQPKPGEVIVHVNGLAAHEGVTVYATRGAALAGSPDVPAAPTDIPARGGMTPALPALTALLFGLLGISLAGPRLIKAGREFVGDGGAADAAFADGTSTTTHRVDSLDLAAMTTIEFAPPKGLTPPQGGVLLKETVSNDHKAAWMMQADIDGFIDVSGEGKDITIKRAEKDGYAAPVLAQMFGGRDTISLKKYDPVFASGWSEIGSSLEGWRSTCGLWDPQGDRNKAKALGLGTLLAVVGGAVTAVGGYLAGGHGALLLPLIAIGSALGGAGCASLVYSGELRMRTPQGSGLWLRTESFRRFLAESEAQHVERAASYGMLREYTAWAVALGEVGRWTSAMSTASLPPDAYNSSDAAFYSAAPFLAGAASSASTAPSSSGDGGGGSGGGGGGGGGGSW